MTATASYGYSLGQTARLVCSLRWLCSRLSEMFESWAAQAATAAAETDDSADAAANDADAAGKAVALELRQLGRRLGDHRAVLNGLQPDSERLAPWREAAPAHPALIAALDTIAATTDSSQRLDIALELLVPQLRNAYGQICERAANHSDGALITTAETFRSELQRHYRIGRAGRSDEQRSSAVTEAERTLAAAGGLIPSEVLCSPDWP